MSTGRAVGERQRRRVERTRPQPGLFLLAAVLGLVAAVVATVVGLRYEGVHWSTLSLMTVSVPALLARARLDRRRAARWVPSAAEPPPDRLVLAAVTGALLAVAAVLLVGPRPGLVVAVPALLLGLAVLRQRPGRPRVRIAALVSGGCVLWSLLVVVLR